jgi:DNA-binding beta-propeller fold protein YncE
MDPAGAFLYVLCADNVVRVFQVDYYSWGHLKPVGGLGLFGVSLTGIAASPTGDYVYVSSDFGVHALNLNAPEPSPKVIDLAQLPNATSIYIEPSGRYLYATTASAIYGFAIASDGTITPLPGGPVAASNQPSSITFSTEIK